MADGQKTLDNFRRMLPDLEVRAIWSENGQSLWTLVVINKKDDRTGVKVVANLKSFVTREHPDTRSRTPEEKPLIRSTTLEECASVVKALLA